MSHTCSRRWSLVSSVVLALALALLGGSAGAQTPPPPETPTAPPGLPVFNPPGPEQPLAPGEKFPAIGPGREIRINEHFTLKFGLQTQVWFEALQDSTKQSNGDDGGYQYNVFLRRLRLLAGAQPWDTVSIFLLIEGTNLGKGSGVPTDPKTYNTVSFVDGWMELKLHESFLIEAGLMLVPLSRNVLQATTTYITLDVANISAQHLAATQTRLLRDLGLMLKGTVLEDHFEYRLGLFSGIRDAPVTMASDTEPTTHAGAQNAPRVSGYLQYNFLDGDKGYVFNGTYYGKKRIAGVAAGFDFQKGRDKDPYWAASVAAFLAYPLNGPNPKTGADEISALAQFVHYDGQNTAVSLPQQNDFLVEVGYYNQPTKLSVFGKFEARYVKADFALPAQPVPDQLWYGGGIKYNLVENLTNFTLFYQRSSFPENPVVLNSFSQFVFAIQGLYY